MVVNHSKCNKKVPPGNLGASGYIHVSTGIKRVWEETWVQSPAGLNVLPLVLSPS